MDEFPRALCHEYDVQALIDAWEAKHSTPLGPEEMQEFAAAVHFDREECGCDCSLAA